MPRECHLRVLGYQYGQAWANIGRDLIWEINDVKLLGIAIDKDLNFDKYVRKFCSKANQKLTALSRMAKLFSFNKRWARFRVSI